MIDFNTTYLTLLIVAVAVWIIIIISGYKPSEKKYFISMGLFLFLALGKLVMMFVHYKLPTVELMNSNMLGLKTLLSITLGVLPYAVVLGGLIICRNKKGDREGVVKIK